MGSYVDYLKNTALPQGYADLENGAMLLQQMKNQRAAVVTGSGSGSSSGVRGGSYNVSSTNLPAMKGGKVVPVKGARISQGWGKSRISYAAGRHTGMDFAAKSGTRIGSAAAGVVVKTGWQGAYGNAVSVKHKDGKTSFYAHMSGINVKPGQKVKAGQQLGSVGSTGRSTGAHLHFEIRNTSRYGSDINPTSWFSTR